jgi:hypothetical protein
VGSPPLSLSPHAWCEGLLRALHARPVEGPDVEYLERLLGHFVGVDPPANEFGALLVDYLQSAPPSDPATADRLQRSWLRAELGGASPVRSLQETLRTLGALLDEADLRGSEVVSLEVDAERAAVGTLGRFRRREFDPLRLRQQSAARMALRGQMMPRTNPTALDRYEPRLRAVGAALDREPPQSYRIAVTPNVVVVEGSAGYRHGFTPAQLAALLQQTMSQRQPSGSEL